MSRLNEEQPAPAAATPSRQNSLLRWIRGLKKPPVQPDEISPLLRESEDPANDLITAHERILLTNILKLRELKVVNVMIPRAEIVAIEIGTTSKELTEMLSEKQYSRIPVYRDTLDDVLGTIHLKDVVSALARGEELDITKMITDIPIISPAMTILNLLLKMRQSQRHMALVVDEYGGIDGLVTMGDVIESIIGEIDDEHDAAEAPQITEKEDGSILVDAHLYISDFEHRFGTVFSDEERKTNDTLSGLVFMMAGRIPARGEILEHPTGMVFEILEADPRRINLLRIRDIPARSA
jgi:CBS domain containing-hemolysin-like protein